MNNEHFQIKDETSIQNKKELQINREQDGYSLLAKYHESELTQNTSIVKNAIKMIWVGICMLVIGMGCSLCGKNQSWITVIPGAFIDLLSATIIIMVDRSSISKHKYFEKLDDNEQKQQLINLIKETGDPEFTKEMLREFAKKW